MKISNIILLSILLFSFSLSSCEEEPVLPPAEMAIQDRLSDGETPFEIYTSDNTLLDSLYGSTYQGGLIFYLDIHTGAGMVAAPSDQGRVLWGCESRIIGGTSTNIGTGAENTRRINSFCGEPNIAARICDDLELENYTDWYLPSKDELNMMHQNLHLRGFGNFITHRYWSSSEYDRQFAHCQLFNLNTNLLYYDKDLLEYYVRAVRSFDN